MESSAELAMVRAVVNASAVATTAMSLALVSVFVIEGQSLQDHMMKSPPESRRIAGGLAINSQCRSQAGIDQIRMDRDHATRLVSGLELDTLREPESKGKVVALGKAARQASRQLKEVEITD